jgi:hypothetical protein
VRQREELAEGLALLDFEQLKIENQVRLGRQVSRCAVRLCVCEGLALLDLAQLKIENQVRTGRYDEGFKWTCFGAVVRRLSTPGNISGTKLVPGQPLCCSHVRI